MLQSSVQCVELLLCPGSMQRAYLTHSRYCLCTVHVSAKLYIDSSGNVCCCTCRTRVVIPSCNSSNTDTAFSQDHQHGHKPRHPTWTPNLDTNQDIQPGHRAWTSNLDTQPGHTLGYLGYQDTRKKTLCHVQRYLSSLKLFRSPRTKA